MGRVSEQPLHGKVSLPRVVAERKHRAPLRYLRQFLGYGGKGGRTALLSALQAIDHALDRASVEKEPAR